MSVMKAFLEMSHDKPMDMAIGEIAVPLVGADQVKIAVKAAALKPIDGIRVHLKTDKVLQVIFGFDVAGVVEDVGSDVTSLQVGDRVFGFIERSGVELNPKRAEPSQNMLSLMQTFWPNCLNLQVFKMALHFPLLFVRLCSQWVPSSRETMFSCLGELEELVFMLSKLQKVTLEPKKWPQRLPLPRSTFETSNMVPTLWWTIKLKMLVKS
jgi:hypothetical protein